MVRRVVILGVQEEAPEPLRQIRLQHRDACPAGLACGPKVNAGARVSGFIILFAKEYLTRKSQCGRRA